MQWNTEGGVTRLQPPGQSPDYRPAQPGRAEYDLLVAPGPIRVPEGPVNRGDLGALGRGVRTVSSFVVDWSAP